MTSLTFKAASEFTTAQLAEAFNAAYQGYVAPVHVNEDFIEAHVNQHDIDLGASSVVFEGETVVGIVFLGIRSKRGWIGGIGVDQAFRRKGIGKQILDHALESALTRGLRQVWLEVIEINEGAHQLYLKSAFRDVRRLLVIERPASPENMPLPLPNDYQIDWLPLDDALRFIDFERPTSPWQREAASLRKTPDLQGWLASTDSVVMACAVTSVNANGLRWFDIGGSKEGIEALVTHLHNLHPQAAGRLVNLVEDDHAWKVFSEFGYTVRLTQQEMVWGG